ncbi:hypothetical protein [Rhodococcus erythropolis]|uniref:hypothetical protein n=1 Tax=Rhodococcus erythropolis TaxID=1833 RepID=UPI00294B68E8|nr:hypothetical protein [Rhodococcus erythropolis]
MAERIGAREIEELDAGQASLASHSHEVTQLILPAADEVSRPDRSSVYSSWL